MTDSTSTTAADESGITSAKEEHPVAILRRAEGKGLISLASEALHATRELVHHLHEAMYASRGVVPVTDLKAALGNARACLQITDSYLGQLNEVLDTAVPPDWEPAVLEPATHW